ncbi:hypothetical protein RB195_001925 [Necator americanus]|uniref:Uncharacterized protein n=1 Tax=Necator americanus TaxID=51031 RepID=A0ABR1DGW8_NECAM
MEEFEPVQKLYIMSHQNHKYDKIKSYLLEIKKIFIVSHRTLLLRYLGEIYRIAFLVGYPQRLANEDLVWKPFATQQSINQLSRIGTYLDSDDTIEYDVLRPTIHYNAHLSTMVIPITFLQAPISYPGGGAPMYSVYGSLGIAVNHFIAKV